MRALALSMLVASPAFACLWDSDTLKEESLRKKDVAELVRGVISKHSRTFYEAKVRYTKPLIEAGTAVAARYDDLAVAFDHLEQYDEALKVMEEKEAKFPGEYTTLANRGTFLSHQGKYAEALEVLRAAIEKKPDAHFGREQYQVMAIEYLQKLATDPSLAEKFDLLGVALEQHAHVGGLWKAPQRRADQVRQVGPVA